MSVDWEPLPRRKKACRERTSAEINVNCELDPDNSHDSLEILPNQYQKVNDAIKNRTRANKAANTLDAADGCAGEFYECTLMAHNYSFILKIIFMTDLDHTADVQLHACIRLYFLYS